MSKQITTSQIIIGLLFKLENIDNLDIELVERELQLKGYTIKKESEKELKFKDLECFIKRKASDFHGTKYVLNCNSMSYSDSVNEEQYREELFKSEELRTFFRDYDKNKHYLKRSQEIKKRYSELLNANILLISDSKEQCDMLTSYGFNNITWFTSTIMAERAFKDNYDLLKKYHAFIMGNQATFRYFDLTNSGGCELLSYIYDLSSNELNVRFKRARIEFASIYDGDFRIKYFNRFNRVQDTNIKEYTYLGDIVLEFMQAQRVFDVVTPEEQKLPIPSVVKPKIEEQTKIPNTPKELKILLSTNILNNDLCGKTIISWVKKIGLKLGISITFKNNSPEAAKEIYETLDKYDIILSFNDFKDEVNAYTLDIESGIQRDYANKGTSLLAHLECDRFMKKCRLIYSFSRDVNSSNNLQDISVPLLIPLQELDKSLGLEIKKYDIYNQRLLEYLASIIVTLNIVLYEYFKLNNPVLLNNYHSLEQYQREYYEYMGKLKQEEFLKQKPINDFHCFYSNINSFLELPYNNQVILLKSGLGLNIKESIGLVEFTMLNENGVPLCSVRYYRDFKKLCDNQKNVRKFELSIGNKPYQSVTINSDGTSTLNKTEQKALNALYKKANYLKEVMEHQETNVMHLELKRKHRNS